MPSISSQFFRPTVFKEIRQIGSGRIGVDIVKGYIRDKAGRNLKNQILSIYGKIDIRVFLYKGRIHISVQLRKLRPLLCIAVACGVAVNDGVGVQTIPPFRSCCGSLRNSSPTQHNSRFRPDVDNIRCPQTAPRDRQHPHRGYTAMPRYLCSFPFASASLACLSTIGMVSPGGVVSGASVVADVSVPSVGIELSCVGFVGVSGSFWLHPSTETESVRHHRQQCRLQGV